MLALRLRRYLPLLVALSAIEIAHLATRFPGVGGRINAGDSAKFQFMGELLGVSHPPGNPLYLLIVALWVRLPWPLTPAQQVTLLSCLFGALTLAFIGAALLQLFDMRAAVFGVTGLGLGPLFWTFATEAEVYTLNSCLLAASCAAAARAVTAPSRAALVACGGCVLLGFANHLTSIALVPAFGLFAWANRGGAARLDLRAGLWLCGIALLSAAFYAYVPLRVAAAPRYSEFLEPMSLPALWRFVTAERFHAAFGQFSLRDAVMLRMPAFAGYLQKQWMWPVLALLPIGLLRIRERSWPFFGFVSLALAALALFAIGYDIPDPDGFYVPIVTLAALPVGAVFSGTPARQSRAGFALLALVFAGCMLAAAVIHAEHAGAQLGREQVYNIDDTRRRILWDLDDALERIPQGASFVSPCYAYGCVQVINYYRFAAPVTARRKLEFVLPPKLKSEFLAYAQPMPRLRWRSARQRVVCSIRVEDARAMEHAGATVRTIARADRQLKGRTYSGVPLYCSVP